MKMLKMYKSSIHRIIKLVFKQGDNLKIFILSVLYFFRFCYKGLKSAFFFKHLPIVITIIVFLLFSYTELDTIYKNSFENSLISQLISRQGKVIVETGIPEIPKHVSQKPEPDFKIATYKENDLASLSEIALALGGSTLITPTTEFDYSISITRTQIEKYIVQQGDTISTIAEKFGLKWSTVLWENKLNYWSIIQPGNELKILPVDGITHKIKEGENLSYIAQKYKASLQDIIEFNNLDENSSLDPGNILIVPDGTPPPPPKPKYQAPVFVNENYSNYWTWRKNTKCHKFYPSHCTDWVAFQWATEQGQCVPSWGDAKNWFYKAKKSGYATGIEPRKGAIIVITCTSWICHRYGHVGYVEDFDENTVTFSEMNGLKHLAYSKRSVKNITNKWQSGWKILGYIYP